MSTLTAQIRRSRLVTGLATVLTAAAILPAGAMAATSTFGSSLNHDPANAGTSCNQNNLDSSPLCTHVGSFYPGFSGHAQANSGGTITKIKLRAEGPMNFRFKLIQVRHLSSNHRHGQAKVVAVSGKLHAHGPSATGDGSSPVETFNVHIKVQKGDYVGIDTNHNTAEYCSDGTPGQLTFFNPDLSLGGGFRSAQGIDDCLLLVQAVYNH
jgi:hypothetical protein